MRSANTREYQAKWAEEEAAKKSMEEEAEEAAKTVATTTNQLSRPKKHNSLHRMNYQTQWARDKRAKVKAEKLAKQNSEEAQTAAQNVKKTTKNVRKIAARTTTTDLNSYDFAPSPYPSHPPPYPPHLLYYPPPHRPLLLPYYPPPHLPHYSPYQPTPYPPYPVYNQSLQFPLYPYQSRNVSFPNSIGGVAPSGQNTMSGQAFMSVSSSGQIAVNVMFGNNVQASSGGGAGGAGSVNPNNVTENRFDSHSAMTAPPASSPIGVWLHSSYSSLGSNGEGDDECQSMVSARKTAKTDQRNDLQNENNSLISNKVIKNVAPIKKRQQSPRNASLLYNLRKELTCRAARANEETSTNDVAPIEKRRQSPRNASLLYNLRKELTCRAARANEETSTSDKTKPEKSSN